MRAETVADLPALLREWIVANGIATAVIVIAALIANRLLSRLIPAAIARAVVRDATPMTEGDLRKRAATLGGVVVSAVRIVIVVLALLLLAEQIGINVVPLVAGLGLGGIALGLGAQSLVRDVIMGMFIILENQFGKGDMVQVAGVQGWVEEVNLRRTVLRDIDGTVHSIPNGEIKVASNFTRGFSGVNLVVPVASAADVERATALIDRTGEELAIDATLGPEIVQAPRVARIEGTSAAGVELRVLGRVLPGAQWRVATAFRQRLLLAFDRDGIRLGPLPAPPPPSPPAQRPAP
jgi:moderate conductance mechanosensitive channel